MKRIFMTAVLLIFVIQAPINATINVESKIQEELSKIDDLANTAFGNIAAMKQLIATLRAEKATLSNEITTLKTENESLKAKHAKSTQNIALEGTGFAAATKTNTDTTALLSSILNKLLIIEEKLRRTKAASDQEFQGLLKLENRGPARLFSEASLKASNDLVAQIEKLQSSTAKPHNQTNVNTATRRND